MGYCCYLASSLLGRVSAACNSGKRIANSSPISVYYIFSFIRKPRLVLDFTLTIFFNHVILTTYYSGAFPTSIFFWFIMGLCATITILLAEQLCVRRELSEDFKPVTSTEDPDDQASEHSDGRQSMELRTFAG
jgi:protein SYS1